MKADLLRSLVFAGGFLVVAVPAARPENPREIVVKRNSTEYLFYRDDDYYIYGNVPEESHPSALEGQAEVSSFSVRIKAKPTGTQDVPEAKFICQGNIYVIPSHQIVVLGPRPKEPGVTVATAPDPNGSNDMEVLIVWNGSAKQLDDRISLDHSKLPDKITTVKNSTSTRSSGNDSQWEMVLVLRNNGGEPFVLTRECFKNMPTVDQWPVIEILPLHPKA